MKHLKSHIRSVNFVCQNLTFLDSLLSRRYMCYNYSCYTPSNNGDRHMVEDAEGLSTKQNFDLLVESFKNSIIMSGNSKKARVSRFKYERLSTLVEKIKQENKGNKPLVVDGLNVTLSLTKLRKPRLDAAHSLTEQIELEPFLQLLRDLQMTYCPILVILKHRLMDGFAQKLKQIDVYHSVCLENYRTKDDLFVLSAALMFGPRAHVLSNDRYLDHRDDILKDDFTRKLFDEWSRFNFIRYSRAGIKSPINNSED